RREAGDFAAAEAGFERALRGLEADLRQFRAGPLPAGAEEVVLTLLEVAVELAELRAAESHDRSALPVLDEELLSWAAAERLFDAEGDADDWVRFWSLWTELRLITGRGQEALESLQQATQLPPEERSRLVDLVRDDLGLPPLV